MLVRDVVAGLLSVRVEATAVLMLMLLLLAMLQRCSLMLVLVMEIEPQMAGSSDANCYVFAWVASERPAGGERGAFGGFVLFVFQG